MEVWTRPIVRIHHSRFGASEFNPGRGAGGRFDPLQDPRGIVVPTLYGASNFHGAVAEAIFRRVPLRGDRSLAASALMPLQASTIQSRRPLHLIDLRGFGLQRLGISRQELLDSNAEHYPVTRTWAAALYRAVEDADGMVWVSRQHDMSEAVVLFGTRVERHDLEVVAPPRPLVQPHPLTLVPGAYIDSAVVDAAKSAGIVIVIS